MVYYIHIGKYGLLYPFSKIRSSVPLKSFSIELFLLRYHLNACMESGGESKVKASVLSESIRNAAVDPRSSAARSKYIK